MNKIIGAITVIVTLWACALPQADAATGEMGTGIVSGVRFYSSPVGSAFYVDFSSTTTPVPSGCSAKITRATVGADDYKTMFSMALTAKVTGRPLRLYAHAVRDGGCGVDYMQMN